MKKIPKGKGFRMIPSFLQKKLFESLEAIVSSVDAVEPSNNLKNLFMCILAQGVDINEKNCILVTLAAKKGNMGMLKFLLSLGAQVNPPRLGFSCRTPLVEAIQEGHLEIAKFLIGQNADIHAQQEDALVTASKCGYFEMVELLCTLGADIHAQDDLALCLAIQYDHDKVSQFLVEKINKNPSCALMGEGYSVVRNSYGNWFLKTRCPRCWENVEKQLARDTTGYVLIPDTFLQCPKCPVKIQPLSLL